MQNQHVYEMLERAKQQLPPDDAELIRRIVESYDYLSELVEDKKTSIARLRKLMFGTQSEKSKDILGDSDERSEEDRSEPESNAEGDQGELDPLETEAQQVAEVSDDAEFDSIAEADSLETSGEAPNGTPALPSKRPGHGRRSADDYPGAKTVDVEHEQLSPGDACPTCEGGTLYEKTPKKIVHFVGQPPLNATVYQLQKLRCHLCGKLFVAESPPQIQSSGRKYGATAASMIGLLRYGTGLPFNRLQRLQQSCQVPLSASTQWDVVWSIVPDLMPAYETLVFQAAQGQVVYNDDTTIKILELMQENKKLRDEPK